MMIISHGVRRRRPSESVLYLLTAAAGLLILASCVSFGGPLTARGHYDEGVGLFKDRKYEDALVHFNQAVEMDAEYRDAYLYQGRCYLSLARWEEAMTPLKTALRLSSANQAGDVAPLLMDAMLGFARHEYEQGRFKESVDTLREIVRMDPRYTKAHELLADSLIGLGREYLARGELTDAIRMLSDAVNVRPEKAEGYVILAKALYEDGNWRRALEMIAKALKIDSGNGAARELMKQIRGY